MCDALPTLVPFRAFYGTPRSVFLLDAAKSFSNHMVQTLVYCLVFEQRTDKPSAKAESRLTRLVDGVGGSNDIMLTLLVARGRVEGARGDEISWTTQRWCGKLSSGLNSFICFCTKRRQVVQ